MDERERREIEDIVEAMIKVEANLVREREELREAWEHFKQTMLEALRITSIVSWLANKINRLTGK